MFWVYILQSQSSGRFYVGSTQDLEDRITRHTGNRSAATKGRGPWVLVHKEEFASRSQAMLREREIKAWKSHSPTAVSWRLGKTGGSGPTW